MEYTYAVIDGLSIFPTCRGPEVGSCFEPTSKHSVSTQFVNRFIMTSEFRGRGLISWDPTQWRLKDEMPAGLTLVLATDSVKDAYDLVPAVRS